MHEMNVYEHNVHSALFFMIRCRLNESEQISYYLIKVTAIEDS